ncbi:MAG: penicillin-binding protein 2 [Bacteroidota bacterium]
MSDNYRERSSVVKLLFFIAAGILLFKALQIQLLDTSYQARASATAIDKYVLYPSRGLIYDRNKKLLVNNNAMYDLKVTYNQIRPEMDTTKFCELLKINRKTFKNNLDKNFRSRRYSKSVPFVFMSKISAETCARFMEHLHEFPGFSIQLRNVRGYPHKNAAHVLGYLNEVNQEQLEKFPGQYAKGDYIGAMGLEAAYEKELRGRKGAKYILKDNMGREVGPYKNGKQDSVAISGKDLISTLDIDLQGYGEQLMQNKTGSIVAIEPASGEILTMISTPTYDPNLLTINRHRGEAFSALLNDTLKPFFDRSIMAKYPPGSIFKSVVALVGMQEKVLQPNRFIPCKMGYFYNGEMRKCHDHPPPYNVEIAMAHSCNAYFFQTIRDIVEIDGFYKPQKGVDLFSRYLYQFGLGTPLGVDIPNEREGNVPTSAYYDKLYPKANGPWYSPTIMSIGIGQGEVEMTTLQMANLAAVMANRGYYYTPHLIKAFKDDDQDIPSKFREKHSIPIKPEFYDPVVEGMEQALLKGTARVAFIKDIAICGKTGTSQNPHGKDHSVFFAFAPKENPQIAIAVYVEHGIWGATYAAPIASLMIEKYLKGSVDPSRNYLEKRMLEANLTSAP